MQFEKAGTTVRGDLDVTAVAVYQASVLRPHPNSKASVVDAEVLVSEDYETKAADRCNDS